MPIIERLFGWQYRILYSKNSLKQINLTQNQKHMIMQFTMSAPQPNLYLHSVTMFIFITLKQRALCHPITKTQILLLIHTNHVNCASSQFSSSLLQSTNTNATCNHDINNTVTYT